MSRRCTAVQRGFAWRPWKHCLRMASWHLWHLSQIKSCHSWLTLILRRRVEGFQNRCNTSFSSEQMSKIQRNHPGFAQMLPGRFGSLRMSWWPRWDFAGRPWRQSVKSETNRWSVATRISSVKVFIMRHPTNCSKDFKGQQQLQFLFQLRNNLSFKLCWGGNRQKVGANHKQYRKSSKSRYLPDQHRKHQQ